MAAPPYAYGGSSYRNAVLNQMQDDPYRTDDDYRYPQTPMMGRAPTGQGAALTNTIGGLAPTIAGQVAGRAAAGSGLNALAGAAGNTGLTATATAPVLSAGASAGLGLATELGGALLKPKVQAATASPFADLTDPYRRREEGSGEGIAGGAVKWGGRGAQVGQFFGPVGMGVGAGIGALGGAIGGALSKNAASAYSDFSRADAEQAIRQMYQTRAGREVTPMELQQMLQGAGTKPGDRWVGEKGLYSILSSLDKNFAAEKAGAPAAVPPEVALARGLPEAGMNTDPTQVRVGPDGRPIPDTGPGGMTGVPARPIYGNPNAIPADDSGGVYGAPANTAAGTPAATTPPATTPPATTPPAGDQTKWDTDSYAKPAYTAPTFPKTAPAGFNQEKWANPNHQTPKYVVGRLISQFEPRTENMDKAVAEIAKAYPGAKRTGSGDVTIPGVGVFDILVGADVGGKRWHAGSATDKPKPAKGTSAGGGGAASLAGGYNSGGDVADSGTIADIIKRIQGISGGRTQGVTSARDAVLNLF